MEAEAAKHRVPIIGPAVARVLYQYAADQRCAKEFLKWVPPSDTPPSGWRALSVTAAASSIPTAIPKNADKARRYFERAGVSQRITVRVGDALELLSEEKEPYDIIFNDVDKTDYPRVFRMALPHLKSGGLFITDNVLWSGRVGQAESRRRDQSHPRTQPADVRVAGRVHDGSADPRRGLRLREEVAGSRRRRPRCPAERATLHRVLESSVFDAVSKALILARRTDPRHSPAHAGPRPPRVLD